MTEYDFTGVNFTGFSDETIEEIKADCLRFLDHTQRTEFEEIDGSLYGNDNIMYFVSKNYKNDLNVQVVPKGRNSIAYKYGIYIFRDNGETKVYPYHHPMD